MLNTVLQSPYRGSMRSKCTVSPIYKHTIVLYHIILLLVSYGPFSMSSRFFPDAGTIVWVKWLLKIWVISSGIESRHKGVNRSHISRDELYQRNTSVKHTLSNMLKYICMLAHILLLKHLSYFSFASSDRYLSSLSGTVWHPVAPFTNNMV